MRQALLLYYLLNAILLYFQISLKFISRNIDKNKKFIAYNFFRMYVV